MLRSKLLPRRLYSTFQRHGHEEFIDIAIVGGGPVGLALAGALGSLKRNLRVVLVEAGDLSKVKEWNMPKTSYSNRVSSLTNASLAFLRDIGAWKHVEEERTCSINEIQAWDGQTDARIDFSSSSLGLNGIFRLTENLNLQRALLRQIHASLAVSGVTVMDKTKVTSIERDEDSRGGWPIVHLDNLNSLRARLLVGADGFNSPVRSYANISSYGWSYDTHAIVATLSHAPRNPLLGEENTTAYQRFLRTGPIAFLPLSPTTSSLVWSTLPPLAMALKACEPEVLVRMINAAYRLPDVSLKYLNDFILRGQDSGSAVSAAQIQQEIAWREKSHGISSHSAFASAGIDPEKVGVPPEGAETLPPLVKSIQPGTVASFPLKFNHADSYIGEGKGSRTVLVGDAAHTIHPLAGQGLNLGLADVECLARSIGEVVENGGDIGSYTSLLPYSRERYFENHKIMSAVDHLHKLYRSTSWPVTAARSVGVEVLNELDTIKAAVMMTAGGMGGASKGVDGWDIAGKALEGVNAGLGSAEMIGKGVRGMVGNVFEELAKRTKRNL